MFWIYFHLGIGMAQLTLAPSMRAPQTETLFCLAVGLFVLTSISVPNYYPAPVQVLTSDGSPLFGPDGKPVVHRDTASYYRYIFPGLIFLSGTFCFFVWWLIRIVRLLYARASARIQKS